MRVLYHAMHETLEYDDVRILKAAGCDVFSLGSYAIPNTAGNRFRGSIPDLAAEEDFQALVASGSKVEGVKITLTPEFVRRFDVVIFNQFSSVVLDNIEACAGVRVVYRSVGQSSFAGEAMLRPLAARLSVVRYAAQESHPDFLPTDAVIPFGKFVDEYPAWIGGGAPATFMNIAARDSARPLLADYQRIVEGTPAKLYGMDNEGVPNWGGLVPAGEQVDVYRRTGAYLYIHSLIASYTLNVMEAMLVGAPVLAPSRAYVSRGENPNWWPERYAVDELLADGAGLVFDDAAEGRALLGSLIDGRDVTEISRRARARAQHLFDARTVARAWRAYLDRII